MTNGDGKTYRVTLNSCECKDFAYTSTFGLRCKHIEAVQLLFKGKGEKKMDNTSMNGWVKLYHPSGVQVTLPVSLEAQLTGEAAKNALDAVSTLISQGWMVEAPGLDDGEQKQEVVSVSRRESKDRTPIVAFYLAHPKTVKKFIHAYLNTPEDVQAFESATGLRLEEIPLWPGERDIDKDHREAGKYIVQLPQPINIVWSVNPKWQAWSAEGGKSTGALEPHKRLIVRYDSASQVKKPLAERVADAYGPAPAAPAPAAIVRKFGDGTSAVEAAYEAYDLYLAKNKAAPDSLTVLREWYKVSQPAHAHA